MRIAQKRQLSATASVATVVATTVATTVATMSSLAVAFIFFTSASAIAADKTLLDCEIPGGDTFRATVIKKITGELILQETDTEGLPHARELLPEEWNRKSIHIFTYWGGSSTLKKSSDGWWLRSFGFGSIYFGQANCQ